MSPPFGERIGEIGEAWGVAGMFGKVVQDALWVGGAAG